MAEDTVAAPSVVLTLELLPSALVGSILSKLDVSSLCSIASTSRLFRASVPQIFSFLPEFDLQDIAPTFDLLRPLLPPNPYLRILKVDCRALDDSSIAHLINPSLREICLQNCENFSGYLLREIGKRCKDLRFLYLGNTAERKGHEVLISDLQELLIGCTQLESLNLMFDISTFSRHSFAHVWSYASGDLRSLEIGFISSVMMTELLSSKCVNRPPQYSMQPILFPNLQKLSLSVDYITDTLVTTISKGLVSLSHLDLQDAPIIEPAVTIDLTNAGLQQINSHGRFRHLSLVRSQEFIVTYFKRVNDLGVLLMADKCSNLESISLGGFCRVTDAGMRAILHSCTNLRKLRVCHGTKITNLMFHDISATSLSLTHVGLRCCSLLTNTAFTSLATNKDLKVLDLRDCLNLGDDALKAVGCLPNLQVLLLDGSNVTDLGLSYLRHSVTSLTTLSVRGCPRLTDQCITAIFESPFSHKLQILDLSNLPNLTDDGILFLAKSGIPLFELHLRECPHIGDTSVMALASMKIEGWSGSSLRLLDVYESGMITKLAIQWLKRPYFPRLRWLGVTGSVNRDMVDSLARSRPFLHIACRGEELGCGYWDTSDGFCRWEHEEVDELEQWLLEGEDESDESDDGEMMLD
ncbi:F-box/LRR-repeat protein 10 [Aristolochia californica]|uniref:F-box/LRR-repeat protein 10 n=1 Tax=Aristolochia californica TaxID=171875 RepID=UPI0035E035F2